MKDDGVTAAGEQSGLPVQGALYDSRECRQNDSRIVVSLNMAGRTARDKQVRNFDRRAGQRRRQAVREGFSSIGICRARSRRTAIMVAIVSIKTLNLYGLAWLFLLTVL
jgi:hypothetical protein